MKNFSQIEGGNRIFLLEKFFFFDFFLQDVPLGVNSSFLGGREGPTGAYSQVKIS